jgi:hypothetical protein
MYGRKTWSSTIREDHTMTVFESRMLRRIFGTKREEVARGWRRLRNEEFYNLYSSPNITIRVIKSRRTRWLVHAARMGEIRSATNILVGKPEGKRLRARPRRRWEDNIRMGLREIVWKHVNWIHLAQDMDQRWALVNTVMNFQVP